MPEESVSTPASSSEDDIDIDYYRLLVRSYIDLHLYQSALFWADKVVTLSNGEPKDVLWLAQCMYLLKQYHRAALVIKNRGLDKDHLVCRYLAAKCLLEAREYSDALAILNTDEQKRGLNQTEVKESYNTTDLGEHFDGFPKGNLYSAILHLKGRIYEALDNRSLASECYKQALKTDVHCYDSFQALVQHQMLSAAEEKELLASLPISSQCKSKGEEMIVRNIYECLLKKYQAAPSKTPVSVHPRLEGNLDLEVSKAERHYYACSYNECFNTTQEILKKDPYHMSCLPIHIACLVELNKSNALFFLAHDLVALYPEMAVSWFAVGCYYYIKSKSDPARRYLGKATAIDRFFGPAWLVYGHSFAVENEHDQAMAAYFKASQLMKGCHLPLLYIGLECGLTNNLKLAEKFFIQARIISPDDPFVIHEMGVVAFQNNEYEEAEVYFEQTLEYVGDMKDSIVPDRWEALFNNLGHTYRKLKKYEKALEFHQKALLLSQKKASTLASIGFVQALLGRPEEAAESFHKALGIRRDDSFSTTMLSYVMEQLVNQSPPFYGGSTETLVDIKNEPPPPTDSDTTGQMSVEMDMEDTFQNENSFR